MVPRISGADLAPADAGRHLAASPSYPVDAINWPDFGYCPSVGVSLGYDPGKLYIQFAVTERAVIAQQTAINSLVCRDSCVELFITSEADTYTNVEFNCIGVVLAGRGSGRADRQPLSPEQIAQIQRTSTLGTQPFPERLQETSWQLTAAIPFELIGLAGKELPGRTCRANLYKCGDGLSVPHYVTWNPVHAPAPDFHRPECFGQFVFE